MAVTKSIVSYHIKCCRQSSFGQKIQEVVKKYVLTLKDQTQCNFTFQTFQIFMSIFNLFIINTLKKHESPLSEVKLK